MIYHEGLGSNGLAVIADARTETDWKSGGVLRLWSLGHACLGKREWEQTLRITLRDWKQSPLARAELNAAREDVFALLAARGIKAAVLMQTGAQKRVKTVHQAWNLLRPGNPYAWAGTVIKERGIQFVPCLNPSNYDYVYTWLTQRWFQRAKSLAASITTVVIWPKLLINPNEEMLNALDTLSTTNLVSVDIETNTGGSLITALGFSSADLAVSIPWDSFPVSGTGEMEPGILDYPLGEQIKSKALQLLASDIPKVGQNFSFDIYALRERGFSVGGEAEDTLLLGRTVYPQFKRNLQQLAAYEFAIEPWKSEHKAPNAPKGVKEYDKWLATPLETRLYNCKDCLVTHWLYTALMEKLA